MVTPRMIAKILAIVRCINEMKQCTRYPSTRLQGNWMTQQKFFKLSTYISV